jgi:hypothetical protein
VIVPASGSLTPQPTTPPTSPQNNILKDPSIENILNDVDASLNGGAPKQEQLNKLLEELQKKDASVSKDQEPIDSTQKISTLIKVTPPPSINRSYRVIGGLCVAFAIAIAIFYARKLLCQTTEQTSFTPVP